MFGFSRDPGLMAVVRYGARSGVSYSWTPQVPLPFGKGLKPCSQPSRPDLMFPHPKDDDGHAEAMFACGLCDVREECLAEALRQPMAKDFGIWGGTTEQQRRSMRRRAQREARKAANEPSVWPRPSWTLRPRWAGPTLPAPPV